ncbi:MAG: helix-hairpin-helix domain-containing protein [Ruminococcus sp.]|nr:helix-hairpin-helix domain-containing protein [Ruminococcus sp.]
MAENGSAETRPDRTAPPADAPQVRMRPLFVLLPALAVALFVCAAFFFSSRTKGLNVSLSHPAPETSAETSTTPAKGPAAAVTSSSQQKTTTAPKALPAEVSYSFPADINETTAEQIYACPNLNKTAAESILSYRQSTGRIHDLDELLNVYGIGEKTLQVIKESFYISEADYIPSIPAATAAPQTAPPEAPAPPEETTTAASDEAPSPKEPDPEPQRRPVDINTASAEEIAEALLLTPEEAEKIVKLREDLVAFSVIDELIIIDGFTPARIHELEDYIIISPSDKIDEHGVILRKGADSRTEDSDAA